MDEEDSKVSLLIGAEAFSHIENISMSETVHTFGLDIGIALTDLLLRKHGTN